MKKNLCLLVITVFTLALFFSIQGCCGSEKTVEKKTVEQKIVLSLPNPDKAVDAYKDAILNKDVEKFKATITEGHLDKLNGIIETIKMQNKIKDDTIAWDKFLAKENSEWKEFILKRHPVKKSDDSHAEINFDIKNPTKNTNIRIYLEQKGKNWKIIGCSKFKSSKYIKQSTGFFNSKK